MSTRTTPPQEAEPNADTLSSLNDDCMLSILSFLHHSDLNSFALCSRRCHEARSFPSLDQTRTSVVVCSEARSILYSEMTYVRQLYNAFDRGHWNNDLYSGNQTHLRVVAHRRHWNCDEGLFYEAKHIVDGYLYAHDTGNIQLTGVTHLDLPCSPQDVSFTFGFVSYALALILPNLQELDLGYLSETGYEVGIFCRYCRNLTRVTGNGSLSEVFISGSQFRKAANLTELNLDDSRLKMEWDEEAFKYEEAFEYESEEDPTVHFMWKYCEKLQRLSMKNTVTMIDRDSKPISQAMIMKLVQRHPALQWIRSDLTQENIATLQQERPDITFVNE